MKLKRLFPFSLRDLALSVLILATATLVSFPIKRIEGRTSSIALIYVFAVFLISRYTDGYLFGTVSSLIAMFLANYMFYYPFFSFNFTSTGYPITFFFMFLTSVMTSALTTQVKEQEKVRAEAEKEKLRGDLLRAVSHDIRTPLTSIVGATSALLDEEDPIPPEEQRALLRDARDDAESLIRMVENLLSVTRFNASDARLQKSPEVVEEIIAEAVRKFRRHFPGAEVRVSVPQELLIVPMDAMLIEQVLINLMENAVIHGGSERIDVVASSEESGVRISVRDYGRGIAPFALSHLFEPLAALTDGRETDRKRNMGIGLSVSMSIIRAHGGGLCAENHRGGGAEFIFTLPAEDQNNG